MRHVYILAIIVFGVMIGTPLAQITQPSVDRIVSTLTSLVTLPGQSTVGMAGSLVQCRGQNVEQTPVSNAQNVDQACDLYGRQVLLPYTTKEKWIRGTASATTTAAATFTNFTAVASVTNYVTSINCFRTDVATTLMYITLNDNAATVIGIPPTNKFELSFPIPLATAPNTALTFTESATTNAVFCSAQGYQGA